MNPPKTLAQWLIMIVIVGALVAIGVAAAQHFGIGIPPLVWTLLWVVLGASLIILAIRFLMSLGGFGGGNP